MSVLIKGLIMPSCCDGCTFSDWSNLHQTASCKLHDYDPCFSDHSREYTDKRADFCPLIEIPDWDGHTEKDVTSDQECLMSRYDAASGYARSGNEAIRTESAKECEKCAAEHRQLAAWLRELRERREAPEIVRCKNCIYYDPPHVENNGVRYEYAEMPKEAFDELGTGLVNVEYGINIGGRCTRDYNIGYGDDKRVYVPENNFCGRAERRTDGSV